jgi:hypothetical protein
LGYLSGINLKGIIMKKLFTLSILLLAILTTSFAAVSITKPSLTINTCSYPSSYNTLGDIIIDENSNGDFSKLTNVTLILTAPANFEFQAGVGSVSYLPSNNISAATISITATTITITYTTGGTNKDDQLTISGIMVRAITSASSGNITRTGGTGTIAGLITNTPVTTLIQSVTLTVPTSVTASASPNPLCAGNTLTLTGGATNATSWSWSGPNSYASTSQSPTITSITAAGAGVYSLTASNSCGSATAVSTSSVTVNALPTCTAPATTPVSYCQNAAASALSVTGTAGSGTISSYKWYSNTTASNSGGTLVATHNVSTGTDTYTPVTTATGALYYYVVVTNSNSCTITGAVSGAVTILPNTVTAPTAGTHTPSATQIIWNWNTVSGATGYKWSATNNYATATDLGNVLTKTETGLVCNTAYTRYVWAYNSCGYSSVTTLSQSTSSTCPPANDAYANATSLPCGTTNLAGTTVGSESETAPGSCVGSYGVWYTFTGNGYSTTVSSTATFDHGMYIGSGSCGSLTQLVCKDDAMSNGTETYTFTATNGTNYYVYIAYYSGATTGTFTISRTCVTPCSGTPAPGNTAASINPVCSGISFTLSMTNTFTDAGITYQWQSSPDNSTWSNISGATSATYATSQTTATYYRCNVTCSNSGLTGTSTALQVTMNTPANCYCNPSPTSVDGTGITNVTCGAINNTTGTETNNYGNYSAQIASFMQSSTATVNITYSTGYTYLTKIWVDWNDDGDFDDAGEEVYSGESLSANPTTLVATFNVPVTATVGNHRMRIGGCDSSTPIPCYASSYGTYEDYTLNVTVASACSGTPAPGNTVASVNPACSGVSFTLSTSNTLLALGLTYQWQSSPNNSTWTDISGATSPTYAASQTTATYYRCNVTCSNSAATGTSTSLQVTMNTPANCYCSNTNTTNTSYYISSFSTTGGTTNITNNSSGFSTNGYGNFLGQVVTQIQNGTVNFSITETGGSMHFGIWVDWNQDGDFVDSGEEVYYNSTYATSATGSFTVPLIATAGSTRMRVVGNEGGTVGACIGSGYTECEDYTFTVTALPACSGTPSPGNTVSSLNPVCASTSFVLSLSNTLSYSGITYQWQSSPDNATWTDISGATSPTCTTSQTSATYYRCKVTCTPSATTVYSTVLNETMSSFISCMCTSTATSTSDMDITNVKFGTINNTSATVSLTGSQGTATGTAGMNSIWTASAVPIPSVQQGATVSFSATIGGTAYSHRVDVYFDFNHDGDLTDAGESFAVYAYANPTLPNTSTYNITIPFSAATGNTLMRVVCIESSTSSPCGTYTWGETEDYLINITAAPACSGTPTGGTATAATTAFTCSGSTTVTLSGYTNNVSGITLQWQESPNGSSGWANVSTGSGGNTAIYTTPTLTSTTYYRCVVTCTNGGGTANSSNASVTINANVPGTASASVNPVCVGETSVLSLTGATIANSTYQWQISSNNSTWSDISGATSSTYTATVPGAMYYRCNVTCTASTSMLSSASVLITVTGAPTYATLPYYESFEGPWASVCNTREVPSNHWSAAPKTGNNSWRRNDDGAAASWSTITGGVYSPTFSAGSYSARFHSSYASSGLQGSLVLFADCSAPGNKSLIFDYINTSGSETFDVLQSTDGGATFPTTLGTYSTASAWTTKTISVTSTSATTVFKFRATSDYGGSDIGMDNLMILPACSGTPAPGNTVASTNSICLGDSVTLSLSNTLINPGITFQWQSSPDNSTWTDISGATSSTYSLIPATATYFRCHVTCVQSGLSSNSVAVQVTFANAAPTGTGNSRNCEGTVSLSASTSSGTLRWYSSPTSSTVLGTGTTFTTPSINSTTTYYVAAESSAPETVVLGTGSSYSSSSAYTPFYTTYESGKHQILVLASELTAAGLSAGNITSLALNVYSVGGINMKNFNVAMGSTATTALTTTYLTGLTTVYSNSNYIPAGTGWQTITFSTPFAWDGTSNVVVEMCFGNNASTATGTSIYYTSTSFTSHHYGYQDDGTGCSMTAPTNNYTGTYRPNFKFAGSSICSSPRTPVTATINGAVSITGTTPGRRCGTGTVALGATASGGTINWYSALTGGTSLGTGTSYTTGGISATTTYYVDADNGTCISTPRTAVIATVDAGVPSTPTAGTHTPTETQIGWNWNAVSGATGYQWSTTNNYPGAGVHVVGNTYTQTGLTCNTSYTLYVWAYNSCGYSTPVTLTSTTTSCSGSANSCENSLAFCASEGYIFPASTGIASLGNIGCLYTTPNPAWYFMQIGTAGDIVIDISADYDVDFIAWGPYTTLNNSCANIPMTPCSDCPDNTENSTYYPESVYNITDCSYDIASSETVHIPNAQVGEIYVLLITNYSNNVTDIDFRQTSGAGATNCGIVPPTINSNGPLCIGETLQFSASSLISDPAIYDYSWSGPNGFTSTIMEPSITNVGLSNAGTYTLTIIYGIHSTEVTTDVVINNPTVTSPQTGDFVFRNQGTDWNTYSNWLKYNGSTFEVSNIVPTASSNVFISKNTCPSADVTIAIADATCNNLKIDSGKTLTVVDNLNLTVAGNWTNNGTFVPGKGTVFFNGTSAITGTTLSLNFNNVTVNSTKSLTAPSGNINIVGNWLNSGTFTHNNGTVTFNGIADQNITTGTGSPFYKLTIQNSSTGITLLDNATVAKTLTLTDGIVTTGSNYLISTSTIPTDVTGYSSGSFVYGNLRRYISNGNTYALPVGGGITPAEYHRADLANNITGGTNYVNASVTNITESGDQIDANLTATQDALPLTDALGDDAIWTITPDVEPTSGSYGIELFVANTDLTSTDDNSFCVVKRPTNSTTYSAWNTYDAVTTIPAANQPGRIYDGGNGYAERTGLSSFSQFSMAKFKHSGLPIDLLGFEVVCKGEIAVANWSTASETNNNYFVLECSKDMRNFYEIGRVPGAGNSNEKKNYSITNNELFSGDSYYRLKQVDYDGHVKIYDPIPINCDRKTGDEPSLLIYPNPFTDELNVVIEDLQDNKFVLEIFDELGRHICSQEYNSVGNSYYTTIDLKDLKPAVYNLRIKSAGQIKNYKIVKK